MKNCYLYLFIVDSLRSLLRRSRTTAREQWTTSGLWIIASHLGLALIEKFNSRDSLRKIIIKYQTQR